jgi:glycosyltransferase involved in cell wall biosynthesis
VSAQQSRVRKVRFPFDLLLARALHPLVITAHNLKPHWTAGRVHPLFAYSFRLAGRVIVHSSASKELLVQEVGLTRKRVVVIPHGDLLDALPALPPRDNARAALSLQPAENYALVFGRLSRYKGVEELIAFWAKAKPNTVLAVLGEGDNPAYTKQLAKMVSESGAKIMLRASKLDDHELSCWLSAADCALFNYSNVFTSGAANLARSAGIPILLPKRLSTVDLKEPCSSVFRFDRLDEDFERLLLRAASTPRSESETQLWRERTSWKNVALETVQAYSQAIRTPAGRGATR